MNQFVLVSQIFRGKWFIEPNFAMSQGPVIAGLINGKTAIEPYEDDREEKASQWAYAVKPGADTVGTYSLKYRSAEISEGSVAVIRVNGTLMKADYCGAPGMATIGRYIKQADKHPNIDKIILLVDSPGGTVDGTEALADIVKATETPIEGLIDGMACSAAAWIISATDKVWATNDFDEVGSIGVLLSFADVQPYYEKQGVKFHTLTASTSPDKVKWYEELKAGNYENYIKDVLNPLDERFMSTIKTNLPEVKDEHLTGKVFFAKDVMGVFVDAIGTLDEILSESIGEPSGVSLINNQKSNSMEKLTAVVALMALASLQLQADKDGGLFLNAEQLEALNTALEAQETVDTKALTAERDNALAAQQTAEGSLETANTRITELEAQLEEKPGAESAQAKKKTDATKKELVNDEFAEMANASELYNSIKN